MDTPSDVLLPGLPDPEGILARYRQAAGNELDKKFMSPESSSALVANAFGFFRKERALLLPPLPGGADWGWPAKHLEIEVELRFPWRGGKHPWLDAVVETRTHLIGIESKRFEPFRSEKDPDFSEAHRFVNSSRPITSAEHARHRDEIAQFATAVTGDEVQFAACSYRELLAVWAAAADADVRRHAEAVDGWIKSRERTVP